MKAITEYKNFMKETRVWGVIIFCATLFWSEIVVAAPLDIFVAIAPQKYLVDRLGGELVQSHVLIGQGQSPHMFHPTSKQVLQLSRAKLFFTIDMEFEDILLNKMQQSMSSLHIVNSVRSIVKIPLLKHEDEHEHENHAAMDPHVWLSPMNLIKMANNMTEALVALDSQHAEIYTTNLEKLSNELKNLDKEIQNMLAPFAGESFFVFHPSFGYFADRYHLQQKAVEVAGKSPTPKQLLQLIRQAKQEHVKVIFVQEQFDPRSGAAIARAIDGEVVALNPLAEDVVANLRTMAEKIRSGVSHQ